MNSLHGKHGTWYLSRILPRYRAVPGLAHIQRELNTLSSFRSSSSHLEGASTTISIVSSFLSLRASSSFSLSGSPYLHDELTLPASIIRGILT